MNCLAGDLLKGFWELMALSHPHAIFASEKHTSGFSACAQQCSMLTLAGLSRVPVSTDTLGCSRVLGFFLHGITWRSTSLEGCSRMLKKALKKVFGAPFWGCWNGIFSLFFLSFFWNSWFPISREFSIANFKSYRDFWSLDLSIAQCDCLTRSLDSSIMNLKIPSIAKLKIPSITKIKKIPWSQDKKFRRSRNSKILSIAKIKKFRWSNTKNSVDGEYK
jgi:hypothetical protein